MFSEVHMERVKQGVTQKLEERLQKTRERQRQRAEQMEQRRREEEMKKAKAKEGERARGSNEEKKKGQGSHQGKKEGERNEKDALREEIKALERGKLPPGAQDIYTCCDCGSLINTALLSRCVECAHDKCEECRESREGILSVLAKEIHARETGC